MFLAAGESKTVTVKFDDKAFRYFNVKTNRWEVETADYEVLVAANAADVRLTASVKVQGTGAQNPYGSMPGYEDGKIAAVSDEEFAKLLGHPIPDGSWSGELGINDAICQLYYAKTGIARFAYKIMRSVKEKSEAKGTPDLNILFLYNMPLRAMAKMSGGMMSMKMVDDVCFLLAGAGAADCRFLPQSVCREKVYEEAQRAIKGVSLQYEKLVESFCPGASVSFPVGAGGRPVRNRQQPHHRL